MILGIVILLIGLAVYLAGRAEPVARAIGIGLIAVGAILILIAILDSADNGGDNLGAVLMLPLGWRQPRDRLLGRGENGSDLRASNSICA